MKSQSGDQPLLSLPNIGTFQKPCTALVLPDAAAP